MFPLERHDILAFNLRVPPRTPEARHNHYDCLTDCASDIFRRTNNWRAQVSMMLGHEIFDPEIGKRVLVDHAFIIAGGEIAKAARNWLGNKLDATKRSQILFMDRDDILNLFVVTSLPLPIGAVPTREPEGDDDLPF
jgi:hypothetical protein